MKMRDNFGELTEKCQVKRLQMEYRYTWVMKNVRNYYTTCGHHDESPTFAMGQNNEYEWKLNIYLSGLYTNGYVEIFPVLINKASHINFKFFIEVSIINKDGQEKNTRRLTLTMENSNGNDGAIKQFCHKDNTLNDPNLIPNGELTLSCRFSFEASSTAEETIGIQYLQYYQKSQIDNFEQLYGNQELSDFKLVIGKTEIPVHQAILAARSSVFKAMFLSDMRENKEKKVAIEDVDPEIMIKVLLYIYSGKVDKIQDIANEVLPVADKYQLDGLKQICEDVLAEQLSTENIYKMLEFSDNYNAKNLKMKGIDFFKKNSEKLAVADDFRSSISSLPANLQTDIICASAKKN